MSNKRISHEWENELEELLRFMDNEIVNSLHDMQALGMNIDEKFGQMFVKIVKNR